MTHDPVYWKQRCEAAENALRRARTRVWVSPERMRVLAVLADLKEGETLTTSQIAASVGLSHKGAEVALRRLEEASLVDRSAARGCHYRPVRWRLGHMVMLEHAQVGEPC